MWIKSLENRPPNSDKKGVTKWLLEILMISDPDFRVENESNARVVKAAVKALVNAQIPREH